ncbi:tape measure protein [Elizabethkingia anophelis]|uniref:tape measure protein n=1 Tax=Elizabethkingia anophelis TaxID=1117645 RepID=UPI001316E281|nr:tape measure protein [Elizabethkingia anophelis]BBQ09239.1 hypothetical protein JUNP353_3810 [Elizabethkingia anophelis]
MSALNFEALLATRDFENGMQRIRNDIKGVSNLAVQEAARMDSAFKNLSTGIAGYFSAQSLMGLVKELINVRGEFQKTEIAFATMLGDANQAKSLMGDMVNLAAKTPFSLQDVSNGAKQLLAFQIPASQVVDTLTRMGNIAAGLSIPLSRINLVYGQVKAKGKLMGDDLRQFTEAGIPMVAELAKKFNKSTAEISDMVSAGKIGFKDVKDVLFSMTNEGGMFFNLMEKQSASLSGKISNLEDAWDQMLNKLGEANEGILNDAIDGLAYLVDHYQDVLDILTVIVATYGAYRAALILTTVAQQALAIGQNIANWINLARGIKTAADAQALFNLTTNANPFVALITLIALATSTYAVYGDQIRNLLSISKEFNASQAAQAQITEKYHNEFSKGVAKSKAEIDLLVHTIRNENTSLESRKKAYEKLISIDPAFRGTLDAQFKATDRLASMFDYVTKKMQEFAKAQARMAVTRANLEKEAQSEMDYQKAEYDYQKALEKSSKTPINRLGGDNSGIKNRQEAIEAKKLRDEKFKEYKENKELNEYILKSNDEITAQIQKNISIADKQLKTGMVNGKKANKETIEWVKQLKKSEEDKLKIFIPVEIGDDTVAASGPSGWAARLKERIKSLGEAIDNAPTKELARKLTAQKEALEKELDSINTKKAGEKQLAEIFPEGSVKDLERRAQLLEEALQTMQNGMVRLRKLDKFGHDKDKNGNPYYTGQTVTKEEAKKRLQEVNDALDEKRKEIQVKSFDDEMSETERQWNVRYQLANKYGEEVAKAQFPNLNGVSYFDEIEKRIREFEEKSSKGFKLTDKELQNWAKLNDIFRNLTGDKDPKTQFTDDLDAKLNKMSSQAEKIVYLQREYDKIVSQESIKNSNRRGQGFEAIINQRLESEKKIQRDNYNSLIKEHRSFEEKKAEITKEFEANMSFAKNDSEKEKIRKAYNEQFSAITVEAFRNSKDWETAFGEMEFASKSTLERILQQLINFRQANKDNLSVQDYKIVSDKITEIQNRLYQFDPLKGLVSSYKNYRSDAEKLLKFLSDLEQANVDLADSYDLLNKAQSSEEFEAAMRKHDAALEKRRRATEGVKQAEDQFSNSQKKLISAINSTADKLKYAQEIIGSLKGIFDDLGISMDNAFGDVVSKVEQTLQGLEQVAGGLTKALSGIASGNIFQAVAGGIQAIGGLIKSISGWFNNDKKKERQIKSWANEVENLKNMYKELEYAVRKALGDDIYKGQLDQVKNLQQQQQLLIQMRNKEADKKKSDQGKINDYNSQIEDINRAIQDIRDNIIKTVLQTDAKDLAAQLGDAFIEAFSKGEDAAKALDKVAGDVFRNMVKNALKMRMEKALQPVLDQILKASGFDEKGNGSFKGFTPEQIEQYKKQIAQIGASQEEFLKAYQQLFQDANSNVSGMEGSIKSITSEEAGALIAQINAMRQNQGKTINIHQENLELMRGVLIQLMKIEDNTRPIKGIYKEISELNSKVSKDNGLRPAGL